MVESRESGVGSRESEVGRDKKETGKLTDRYRLFSSQAPTKGLFDLPEPNIMAPFRTCWGIPLKVAGEENFEFK